jgi:spore germination protein
MTVQQALSLNASTIIGVSVLTLPRSVTDSGQQFGWIAVLFGLFISVIGIIVITKLGAKFPGKTIVEYMPDLIGAKWVGRVFSFPILLLYSLYWGLVCALVARMFGEVVVTAVLTNTPLEVIVGTMLLICLYLAMHDVEVVVRVNEILLGVIVLPVLFISLSAYQNAKFEYIMPLIPPGGDWMKLVGGLIPAITSLIGFDCMLMFNRNLRDDAKMMRYQIFGVLVPGVLYLLIVIAGIMSFGYEELANQAWPTLELIKSINVPGLILERLEPVFLGVWVAAVFTTAGTWFYCASWSLAELFGQEKKRRWISVGYIVAIYFMAMRLGGNVQELFRTTEWIGYLGILFAFFIPALLYVIALVRKVGTRKEEAESREVS